MPEPADPGDAGLWDDDDVDLFDPADSPFYPSGARGEGDHGGSGRVVAAEGFGPADFDPADAPHTLAAAEEEFLAPRPVQQVAALREASSEPSPYSYDRKSYRWLRGVVDYDEEDQSWHLMYSLRPDDDDQFGGEILLLDHPALAALEPGDVVLVEGRVDLETRDPRTRKPCYHVDHILGPLRAE